MKAQKEKILTYLRANGSMTTIEAIHRLNIIRAGARIYDLRNEGHNILTFRSVESKSRVAKYVLLESAK